MTYDEAFRAISACRGLRPIRSRYSGEVAFALCGKEVAHFHGREEVDLRLARRGIRMLRSARPRIHRVANVRSDWVSQSLALIDTDDLAYMLDVLLESNK